MIARIPLLALGALAACTSNPVELAPDDSPPSWDEFVATNAAPLPGGGYMFQGDIRVSEERLREIHAGLAQGRRSAVKHEGGVDFVWNAAQKIELSFCVADDFDSPIQNISVANAMRDATMDWERAADVNFVHIKQRDGRGCEPGDGVLFRVRKGLDSDCSFFGCPLASAFFPNDPGYPSPEILIWPEAFDLDGDEFMRIIRHELGHTLGLYHEHARVDQSGSDQLACVLANSFTDFRGLTPYDPSSVMGYPQCEESEGDHQELTAYDRLGARYLYGLPRRYGQGDWFNFGSGAFKNDIFWYVPNGQWTLFTADGKETIRFQATNQCSYAPGNCTTTLPDRTPLAVLWRNDFFMESVFLYGPAAASDHLLHNELPEGLGFTMSTEDQPGRYLPLTGRFHGTDTMDIFWYGPESDYDPIWHPNGDGTFLVGSASMIGHYDPMVGRFREWRGGPRDDILWRDPVASTGYVWESEDIDDFVIHAIDFEDRGLENGGEYLPVHGDFNGDQLGDVFWYAPGDDLTDVVWFSEGSMSDPVDVVEKPVDVRYFKPLAGDFDGNGITDIYWYAPDSHRDEIWLFRSRGRHDVVAGPEFGDLTPIVGQFNTGDSCADILWFSPERDSMTPYRSNCDGTFTAQTALTVPANAFPVGHAIGR